MNRILHEILKSNLYIDQSYLNGSTPLIIKFLSGEGVDMELKPLGISSYSLNTQSVEAHRSSKPIEAIQSITDDTILLITVDSVITKYDSCGWYGSQSYARLIQSATSNSSIKGIVLISDSPGGSADGSYDFAQAVKKATQKIPVVSYVDGLSASAMYRINAHSSKIVAKPGSMIGSIGTMSRFYDFSKYNELKGIVERTYYADGSPDKNKAGEEAEKGNGTLFKTEILNPLNDLFIAEMKRERNLPDHTMTGKIFYPEEALKEGMIDSIGNLEDAIQLCMELSQTPQYSQSNNSNHMSLKIPAVIASFFGLSAQADSISQEQVDQLAKELESNQTEISQLKKILTEKDERINSLESSISEKDEKIQSLEKSNTDLQAKVDKYGDQPGAIPTTPENPKQTAHDLSELEGEALEIVQKYVNPSK